MGNRTAEPFASGFEESLSRIAKEALASAPARLQDSILYSLLGGGKRIRPRIILAVGEALGLSVEVATRLGCALEMVHAFTLIHDDLPALDDDDFRRGRPSNHRAHGEATALLAGDALALLAFDTLLPLRTSLSAETVLEICKALLEAAGARGVIAGQVDELGIGEMKPGKTDPRALLEIFRLKTGALFRAALIMPLLASERVKPVSAERIVAFAAFGEAIGIVFQIADDLEDDFAQEKSNPGHIAAFYSREQAREKAQNILSEARTAIEGVDRKVSAAIQPFLGEIILKIETAPPPGVH